MAGAGKPRPPLPWTVACVLLLLLLAVQVFLLLRGDETAHLEALADGRDLTIDLRTGELKGSLYSPPSETPAASTEPATPAAAPDPATSTAAPAGHGAPPAEPPAALPAPIPEAAPPNVRQPLHPSPDPALTEKSGARLLPRIGDDGTLPAMRYAKPVPADAEAARVAVVLDQVGLDASTLAAALGLDEAITLAFSPYAPNLPDTLALARRQGHEAWLDAPLQPSDYPASDAGPYAILATDSAEAARERLLGLLASAHGYVGLIAPSVAITASQSLFGTLGEELRLRGLLLAVSEEVLQLPKYDATRLRVDRRLPETATPAQLAAYLSDAESQSRRGTPVALIVPAQPALIEVLAGWTKTAPTRHVAIVPLSALALSPPDAAPRAAPHP